MFCVFVSLVDLLIIDPTKPLVHFFGATSIQAAFDNWDPAIQIYNNNFNHPCHKLDLSNFEQSVEALNEYNFDSLVGGPPCQDFSQAGSRSEGNRASLTVNFARLVSNFNPEWFVMENVDRAAKSGAYAKAKGIFLANGYGLTERVLDSSLCGVPQKRKRFFVIGHLNDDHGFLDFFINRNLAIQPMTVRDYLGEELDIDYYYRHPRNYNRRGIFSVDEPSPTVRGVNRPVPAGYPGHHGDPVNITPDLRPLTTMERARLQTFPRDFHFDGNKTTLEQVIGNAVPVEMAAFVARAIQNYIQEINQNVA